MRPLPVLLALAALALISPSPAAADTRDFGKWRVTATGAVIHEWALTSDEPCAAVGSGSVSATARGRSKAFRLSYHADDGFRQWDISPPPFRVRGKVRRTDRTKQNPAEEGKTCKPRRRDGCGTERLPRRAIGSAEGMVPRRHPRLTFSFYNLVPRTRCYAGGFNDFNLFPGAPFANYGRLVGKMPRPASIRRKAFTVRIADRRAKRRPGRRTSTERVLALRFVPV